MGSKWLIAVVFSSLITVEICLGSVARAEEFAISLQAARQVARADLRTAMLHQNEKKTVCLRGVISRMDEAIRFNPGLNPSNLLAEARSCGSTVLLRDSNSVKAKIDQFPEEQELSLDLEFVAMLPACASCFK